MEKGDDLRPPASYVATTNFSLLPWHWILVMTSKNPQKKTRFQRYSFTQAMYNWKPQKQGPEPKFGMGLAILFFVVMALVCYAIYRLM